MLKYAELLKLRIKITRRHNSFGDQKVRNFKKLFNLINFVHKGKPQTELVLFTMNHHFYPENDHECKAHILRVINNNSYKLSLDLNLIFSS